MILSCIILAWFFFATIGLALFELRPDKIIIYKELKKLKESSTYKITFPLVVFIYTPFTIYNSLRKILNRDA